MEDLFVPYEIALEMKLLEFNEPCFKLYLDNSDKRLIRCLEGSDTNSFLKEHIKAYVNSVTAPTFAQCFKFFREKYNLHIVISWRDDLSNYDVSLIEMKKSGYFYYKENLKSYEEAELACLTELINIVKKKKP